MMLGVIGIEAGGKVPGAPARKTLILGRLGGLSFRGSSPPIGATPMGLASNHGCQFLSI